MDNQDTEQALRLLESRGFDVKQLWRELSDKIALAERGTPSLDDVRYTLPTVQPTLAEHFVDGRNPILEAGRMWEGYSYVLSPGQRAILRETYGLTPTMTVTLGWIERWPGTAHPHSLLLTSDVHVDPRNRKHTLTQCVIRNVGEFLRISAEADAEDKDSRVGALGEDMLVAGRVLTLSSTDRWAIADLSGVKIAHEGRKAKVLSATESTFEIESLLEGKRATVPRNAFFSLVEEYATVYKQPLKSFKLKTKAAVLPSLDELIKSLL